jgi:hypothetical protein
MNFRFAMVALVLVASISLNAWYGMSCGLVSIPSICCQVPALTMRLVKLDMRGDDAWRIECGIDVVDDGASAWAATMRVIEFRDSIPPGDLVSKISNKISFGYLNLTLENAPHIRWTGNLPDFTMNGAAGWVCYTQEFVDVEGGRTQVISTGWRAVNSLMRE